MREHERVSVEYVLRAQHSQKKLVGIRAHSFKLGDVVSDEAGDYYKVAEVYWTGDDKRGWKGDVLLRPVVSERKPERKKFNTKGIQSSRRPARNVNH